MNLDEYFDTLNEEADNVVNVARRARKRGGDPEDDIEVEFAEDMAERCEKLLGIPGLAERIRKLEDSDEVDGREEAALKLAEEFATGELGDHDTKEEKIDAAVRTSVALLTEGVVAAPIEGISNVALETGDNGQEIIRLKYAGPIRSAGGTGQALSVLAADYIRQLLDIPEYQPRDEEVDRMVEELKLYDSDTGLQYMPSEEDIRTIVNNLSIMLDGDGATDREVSAYRDLERIDTNAARGGMCLTVGEGIAQKAPKLQRYTVPLGIDGWDWLAELDLGVENPGGDDSDDTDSDEGEENTDGEGDAADDDGDSDGDDAADDDGDDDEKKELKPNKKYMKDIIGGRPVFAYPSKPGGFRLRYGRARNTSLAASGVHPATMVVLNEFIAAGTQLKTERPGKAQGMVPVDSLEGPTVRLYDGTVTSVETEQEAHELDDQIDEILDLGEMSVNYGEFLENNHPLAPASYVHEWWIQEAEAAGLSDVDPDKLNVNQAFALAEANDIPLHPKFTYLWHDLDMEDYQSLAEAIAAADRTDDGTLVLPYEETVDQVEALLAPHVQHEQQGELHVADPEATVLERCCDPDVDAADVMTAVSEAAGVTIRERAPTRIGARMGRPEKSKRREKPTFHSLFPLGEQGGNERLINQAAKESRNRNQSLDAANGKSKPPERDEDRTDDDLDPGYIMESIAKRYCSNCSRETFRPKCKECNQRTVAKRRCTNCDLDTGERAECPKCGQETKEWTTRPLDIASAYEDAMENLGLRETEVGKVKGVKGLESGSKIPEPMEKGILRAKYDINSFADGTARYDLSDLPLTAFKPDEIGTDVETLRDLGYEEDMDGNPLEDGDQLCELMVQDVVLHDDAADYMVRVAKFVDELLEKYYGMEPYYEAETVDDLIGELLVGLAPHTSAGVLCRFIGTTEASTGYAHPFFHAGKRRNCFHPDTYVSVSEDELDGDSGVRIEELVEARLTDPDETDAFGTQIQYLDEGELDALSLTDDGALERKPVTAVSKHPAPDHMVHIETEWGSEVTVTPDHKMVVVEADGSLDEVRASDLKPGMEVPELGFGPVGGGTRDRDARLDEAADVEEVTTVEYVEADCEATYCLEVADTHRLVANHIVASNCDGDEDCFMLLLDGLINYSERFLNHNRTGWSMDKPIVMTTEVDPAEIDDEAHNVDVVGEYPLEFYEATKDLVGPKEVDIDIAEEYIHGDFTGFEHTTETSSIHAGPDQSAYTTVGDMQDKMDAQLDLATRTRAIAAWDVAEQVIDNHFLPDIRGNLRAFAQQGARCHACDIKYRRVPLDGTCRNCDGDLLLLVYEGSVDKYIEPSLELAETYEVDDYIIQSIEVLKNEVDSLFSDDVSEQTGLNDFM